MLRLRQKPKVVGKLCPYCGAVGKMVLETKERIVFECVHGHEYEIKKIAAETLKNSGRPKKEMNG